MLISQLTVTIDASDRVDNVLKFQKSNNEYDTSSSVVCISANSLGSVAIGFQDKHINVYDNIGNYLYSYSFDFNGSYVFEFDEADNIVIIPARGEESYYFSSDAELQQVKKLYSSIESDKHYRKLLQTKKITVNNKNYELVQSFANTKVIQSDENGNQKIFYESKSNYLGNLTGIFLVLAFVLIVIVTVVRTTLNEVKNYKNKIK